MKINKFYHSLKATIVEKWIIKKTVKKKKSKIKRNSILPKLPGHLASLLQKTPLSILRNKKTKTRKEKVSKFTTPNKINYGQLKKNWKSLIKSSSKNIKKFKMLPKQIIFRNICNSFKFSKKNEHNFLKNQKSIRETIIKQIIKIQEYSK